MFASSFGNFNRCLSSDAVTARVLLLRMERGRFWQYEVMRWKVLTDLGLVKAATLALTLSRPTLDYTALLAHISVDEVIQSRSVWLIPYRFRACGGLTKCSVVLAAFTIWLQLCLRSSLEVFLLQRRCLVAKTIRNPTLRSLHLLGLVLLRRLVSILIAVMRRCRRRRRIRCLVVFRRCCVWVAARWSMNESSQWRTYFYWV